MARSSTPILDWMRGRFLTRDVAKTPQGQFNAVMRAHKGDRAAVAAALGVNRRSVDRYIDGTRKLKNSPEAVKAALRKEAARVHQPRVQSRARREAEQRGLIVDTRARLGYHTSAAGQTDQARLRTLTRGVPSRLVGSIFDAMQAGDEEKLRELVAEGLAEDYFREPGGGASDLTITFTDIDYIELDLP
ncbi:XRE family transcriptional regulator [Kitasatospora sp. NPDC004723]|uniref:telomere-protecting terminal protein Tpg n=1 Tax=Kitasatospora sp. NPDC004723 TaxID=3154288 RepID=UPI0033A036CC